jgi:hypothetical protein
MPYGGGAADSTAKSDHGELDAFADHLPFGTFA